MHSYSVFWRTSWLFTSSRLLTAACFLAFMHDASFSKDTIVRPSTSHSDGLVITGRLPSDYGLRPSFVFTKIFISDMTRAVRCYSSIVGMQQAQSTQTEVFGNGSVSDSAHNPGEP
jgi:hypothetical protein